MEHIRKMVQACIQCGTCTGTCPNTFAMDLTPRQLWRRVMMGDKEDIFNSRTFSLCSTCYHCTLRCPRGLPLTEAMGALKRIALQEKAAAFRMNTAFCNSFMESIRRHGRVREMEFMTLFFLRAGKPGLPFRFASLGLRLMGKNKVRLQFPSKGKGVLDALFRKAEALEKSL